MTAAELTVLIGIIAVFTTFAVVLAWASGVMENPPQRRGQHRLELRRATQRIGSTTSVGRRRRS